jgi:capsid protein
MKATILDKIIREVNPDLAVRRLVRKREFDALQRPQPSASVYDAVNDSRLRSHQAWERSMPGDEDHQVGEYDRESMRLECRDLFRNNEIARGIVNRFHDYVVGDGIIPQANTGDEDVDAEYEAWWRDIYTPTADYRQRQGVDLVEFQKLAVTHRWIDGECGFILLENGQQQPIEAERIQTPDKFENDKNVLEGVRRAKGIDVGYYICPRDNDGQVDRTKYEYVERENFVYCGSPFRIDQGRGIPDFAPAINKLRDYDTTDQYVHAKIKHDAINLYNEKPGTSGVGNDVPRRSYALTDSSSENKQRVEKRDWGLIWKHSNLEAIGSKTPNSEYVGYMEHELRAIGTALNLPYEFVMLVFTQGSFTAQRRAALTAQFAFRRWHGWLVKCYLQRVWNWRIAKAVKARVLPPAPTKPNAQGIPISQWFRVTWSLPSLGVTDPEAEANGDKISVALGSSSLTRVNAGKGQDTKDIFREKQVEITDAIERAEEINQAHAGAGVTWRDFTNTSTGQKTKEEAGPAVMNTEKSKSAAANGSTP